MGLGGAFLQELIDLKRSGVIDGADRVAEIGAQQLSDSLLSDLKQLHHLYEVFGREPVELGNPAGPDRFTEHAPSSRPFWISLGFEYAAIDLCGDAIPLDLNWDSAPDDMHSAFDLVVNTGTTEHVVNQENVFRIIHDLTRVGGIMVHEVPAQGMITHGLVNYNPKFFWRLCRENNYQCLAMKIRASPVPTPIPKDVLLESEYTGPRELTDASITAVLRKTSDLPFAPPMDLGLGGTCNARSARDRLVDEWSAIVADRDRQLQETRDELQETRDEMAERIADRDRQLQETRDEMAERIADRDRQLAHRDRQLDNLLASTSWRITAPLRAVSRALRRRR
jgi:SAM-dependent methyltransferase